MVYYCDSRFASSGQLSQQLSYVLGSRPLEQFLILHFGIESKITMVAPLLDDFREDSLQLVNFKTVCQSLSVDQHGDVPHTHLHLLI